MVDEGIKSFGAAVFLEWRWRWIESMEESGNLHRCSRWERAIKFCEEGSIKEIKFFKSQVF
jgi:hypothetical protein